MKSKRIISILLAMLMLLSCAMIANFSVAAEATNEVVVEEIPAKDYNLGYTANDGLILQAWNWSYAEIMNNLEAIAESGYTTIQISPPTELKEATVGVKVLQQANDNGWWMMYQPAAYELNQSEDNVLGTKDELIDMIDAAHELGLFVIADAVINHLGNSETADYKIDVNSLPSDANAVDYLCERAWQFESSRAIIDANAFHYPYANCKYNDTGAFDCTQNAVSLLPDLDTSSPIVQEIILDYWQECVDAGIDGFRIDAAKHIETKYDGQYASNFWDVLMYDGINGKLGIYPYAKETYGKDLYMYGEILNTVSTERSFSWYLEYMNITNSTAFYAICDAVNNGSAENAVPASFNNGMTSKTAILWDESHDTYMDGCKSGSVPSVNLLTKRWACMASRADVVSMYLARPTNTPSEVYNLDLGVAYDTAWNDKATVEINKFHNHFQGTGEAVSSSGNIAVIERSDSGVVLVNCKGNGVNVSIPVQNLADGTYVDQISGNTFVCEYGYLRGDIGADGVAVIYNPETPVLAVSKESGVFTSDTITVDIVSNGSEATYSVNGGEPVAFTGKVTLEIAPVDSEIGQEILGILGDADDDTNVNIKDATLIQKYIAGLEEFEEYQCYLANVIEDYDDNNLPNVNIKDATAIQKHIAGLDSGSDYIGETLGSEINASVATLVLENETHIMVYDYYQLSQDDVTWVKFDNSETQWSKVYCYVFDDTLGTENNAWPGILMTELEDDIWYYELPYDMINPTVIFCDNVLGTGQQTKDLPTINADTFESYGTHFIYTADKWYSIADDGSYTEIAQKTSEFYIVFTDVYGWKTKNAQKIRCYATGGGSTMTSPGEIMEYLGTDENGHDQYYIYIDRGSTTVKFFCTNKSNIERETADMVVTGSCGYYPLAAQGGPSCGTFEVTVPTE